MSPRCSASESGGRSANKHLMSEVRESHAPARKRQCFGAPALLRSGAGCPAQGESRGDAGEQKRGACV